MIELSFKVGNAWSAQWLQDYLSQEGLGWAEAHELTKDQSLDEWEILEAQMRPQILVYFSEPSQLETFRQCWLEATATLDTGQLDISWQEREIRDQIWQQAWQPEQTQIESECFRIDIGSDEQATTFQSGKERIVMRAVKAFGSGQHATTLASLRVLERLPVGRTFLDVGTGTGILAIAAAKLGYTDVLATDIEATACQDAEINRSANQVAMSIYEGSLPPLERTPPDGFDVIVCNILPPVVNQLIVDFRRLLHPEGALVLAGFHEANLTAVLSDCEQHGFILQEQIDERGWLGLHLRLTCQ